MELQISLSIIESHGGRLRANSKPWGPVQAGAIAQKIDVSKWPTWDPHSWMKEGILPAVGLKLLRVLQDQEFECMGRGVHIS
jgi:hypothetical protein